LRCRPVVAIDLSGGGTIEKTQEVKECGLSGTGRTLKRQKLARSDGQIYPGQRSDPFLPDLESFGDIDKPGFNPAWGPVP
jgi:hypothetical protein